MTSPNQVTSTAMVWSPAATPWEPSWGHRGHGEFTMKSVGWMGDDDIWLVVEPYPSEKWWSESQLGWWHSQLFLESHKIHVLNHQPDMIVMMFSYVYYSIILYMSSMNQLDTLRMLEGRPSFGSCGRSQLVIGLLRDQLMKGWVGKTDEQLGFHWLENNSSRESWKSHDDWTMSVGWNGVQQSPYWWFYTLWQTIT